MNPLKCAFGVTSRMFLGFIVKHRGIEVDQSKIKAIQSMPWPRNLHELKSLQGWLAFIRRFISNLAGRCQPFSRLMKKNVPFKLRHYMHAYTIHLVAKADLIIYVPNKAVKGQALADFLADHPILAVWKISGNLPDDEVFYIDIFPTWTMFFDGFV
ncbi:hypothetical protein ACFX2G_038935 [Malus domestica]